jgi:hypothetical protein
MAPFPLRLSCVLYWLVALLGPTRGTALGAGDSDDIAFFEAKIRPVLVERCHECHSTQVPKPKGGLRVDSRLGVRAGGSSGPAVVPGDLEASLLYQAITAADGVVPMPPKVRLSPAEIADFRRWITMGAPDPREAPAATTASSAPTVAVPSRDWWSRKPVAQPPVPAPDTAKADWPRNPIDAFILAKLAEKSLEPAPQADRNTLIRRLSFDLLGLPPTP